MNEAKKSELKRLGKGKINFYLIALLVLMILLGIGVFIIGEKIAAETDEEICLEDGICSETVMKYEECMKEQGAWVKVDKIMICYLPWSTPYSLMIEKVRKP